MFDNVIHYKYYKHHRCSAVVVLHILQILQTPLQGVVCSVVCSVVFFGVVVIDLMMNGLEAKG